MMRYWWGTLPCRVLVNLTIGNFIYLILDIIMLPADVATQSPAALIVPVKQWNNWEFVKQWNNWYLNSEILKGYFTM